MNLYAVAGELLAGWLLADFLTGFFHWWEDRVGNLRMPLIGRWIIAPNRYHHVRPIGPRGWGADLVVWPITALVAAVWWWALGPSWVLAAAALGGMLVNRVHGWAHLPREAPPLVRLLQETGALQSGPHHAGHHRGAFDRRYCILTNWLNPALDAVGYWALLELALSWVGLEPNRGKA